jgi:tRNA modification GTPase
MFAIDDCIVAIATPPGRGGLGIVRISGSSAPAIAEKILDRREPLEPRRATFTRVRDAGTIDEVITTYFAAPHSYTGEHVIEISAHGSPVVLEAIVRSAIGAGARLARPGEFTLRAYLNGKRDLIQAEAVADLINAATPLQARTAFDQLEGTLTQRIAEIDAELFDLIARLEASLDFPDEGYHFIQPAETAVWIGGIVSHIDQLLATARRGRLIREGATVAVIGRPNVGKSSIFNRLAGADRAIVTEIAGTTRDLVTEQIDLDGLAVTLVDTAGWRNTVDIVEREGVARSERAREVADLLVVVLDRSEPARLEDEQLLAQTTGSRRVIVLNKSDLPGRFELSRLKAAPTTDSATDVGAGFSRLIELSARTGYGIDDLRQAIVKELTGDEALRDTAAISNTRHIALLEQARDRLICAQQSVSIGDTPEEFVLTDLQAARACFDEIVGTRTPEDVLQHIFERFCIGK